MKGAGRLGVVNWGKKGTCNQNSYNVACQEVSEDDRMDRFYNKIIIYVYVVLEDTYICSYMHMWYNYVYTLYINASNKLNGL